MTALTDPLPLARALIRCRSVTPADAGALGVLGEALAALGFDRHALTFTAPGTPDVSNLYARLGTKGPNLCFAGHTDVVPTGDAARWSVDPFAAEVAGGVLYGRGAADMKGAIACFVAAVARVLAARPASFGSLSLLITGDEEGPAINGTRKVLQWMAERGERLDACVVGEPTNPTRLGEMIKIGRRGSLNALLTVHGIAGHSAYPHLADNPLVHLVRILGPIMAEPLDPGTAHFQPSTLALTAIDTGNPATNVIPHAATARFNIRFNDRHTAASLEQWLRSRLDGFGARYDLELNCSGESFLTRPGHLSEIVAAAARAVTGLTPELSTSGGTSDARFIKDYCSVVEFGMVGQTMHKTDECASLADLESLTRIYQGIIESYFADPAAPH
ncbi:MAG: succinyl-diaminopimelate desuccinylase [Alphaproteobacteria bacterium]|nr:succinyl-diaminopimelate desuccinylase [Alphaproteobacteria bacterium]